METNKTEIAKNMEVVLLAKMMEKLTYDQIKIIRSLVWEMGALNLSYEAKIIRETVTP